MVKNKKMIYVGMGLVFVVVLIFMIRPSGASFVALEDFEGDIIINKDTSCGCCGIYATYFERNGNENVKTATLEDLEALKESYGIPEEIRSCHTVSIGDYFVEGHVPLEVIEKLLQEKPDIAGLAMGGMMGMPEGSPGMPGVKTGDWIIYGVNYDGSYFEWYVM